MDESLEIVVCHDIIQVPHEDTTSLVWAATQTFTIQHLGEVGADSDHISVLADFDISKPGSEVCSSSNENVELAQPMSFVQPSPGTFDGSSEPTYVNYEINFLEEDPNYSQSPLYNSAAIETQTTDEQPVDSQLDDDLLFIRYKGAKEYASADGEIPCGVCELKFNWHTAMHFHRVEHFGYFSASDRTKVRKCVFCAEEFHSIIKLSVHLFEHYPKMIMMRKMVRARKAAVQRKRLLALSKPSSSSTKAPSRKLIRSKQQKSAISIDLKPSCDGTDPEIKQLNFPITNNDRKTSNNCVASYCEYKSNDIRIASEEFACGVCDLKFREIKNMHHHRIGHFGYYRSLGLPRKCVFCPERFESVAQLSDHLYSHYPTLKKSCTSKVHRNYHKTQKPSENVQ